MLRWILGFVLTLWAVAAAGFELSLPGNAVLNAERTTNLGSYALPTGPFSEGYLPTEEISGRVTRQAWKIESQALTTQQIVQPLMDQLDAAGFTPVFSCRAETCGGFDFRFSTEVMTAPDMFVDLFDYRFLSARKPDGTGQDTVSILVSRAGQSGYVQIIHVAPDGTKTKVTATAPVLRAPMSSDAPIGRQLLEQGHVILSDLVFETGSSALGQGDFGSLSALASFLAENSSARIALVGHTDSVGALDGNIALSKKRAASVLERLVSDYSVSREQLTAEGMGYLSPVASNTTAEGRDANRRVEAVLLNSE